MSQALIELKFKQVEPKNGRAWIDYIAKFQFKWPQFYFL